MNRHKRRTNGVPIAGAPNAPYRRPMPGPPARPGSRLGFIALLLLAATAVFLAVFLWNRVPSPLALLPGEGSGGSHLPVASASDRESARFAHCRGAVRRTCVVDGDTIWYEGEKTRIADINTPETSQPSCEAEAALGARATQRMTELLNQGPFSLEPGGDGRDTDRYGRRLRVITRGGESLGAVLVREGLAEYWKGYRGTWC